jgi:hypothetical protein
MTSGGGWRSGQAVKVLRLSLDEREEISRGLAAGESLRAIASRLSRAPSTVSREVARNGGRSRYRAARGAGGVDAGVSAEADEAVSVAGVTVHQHDQGSILTSRRPAAELDVG